MDGRGSVVAKVAASDDTHLAYLLPDYYLHSAAERKAQFHREYSMGSYMSTVYFKSLRPKNGRSDNPKSCSDTHKMHLIDLRKSKVVCSEKRSGETGCTDSFAASRTFVVTRCRTTGILKGVALGNLLGAQCDVADMKIQAWRSLECILSLHCAARRAYRKTLPLRAKK